MENLPEKCIVKTCPLCKREKQEFFEFIEDSGEQLTYNICTTCGLVFQSPRMGEAELIEFYRSTYRQKVQNSEAPTEKDIRIQAGRARHLIKFISKELARIQHHLDVGSSIGALVRKVDSIYGCDSIGIEPGDAYRAASQSQGALTYQHLQDLPQRYRNRFDFVSIIHTLEHMPDPVGYLRQLRKDWMTPHAMLLVETPNLFGHLSLELTHLVTFSPQTLRQTLEAAGFEIIKLKSHGEPRSPILRLYTTIIARALPLDVEIHNPHFRPGHVRFQRRLGLWKLHTLTKWFPRWTWKEYPPLEDDNIGNKVNSFLTVVSAILLSDIAQLLNY